MSKPIRKVRVKLGVFYYDTESSTDIEYSKTYDVNCEHHVAFSIFCETLFENGTLERMNNMFGDVSNYTDLSNEYYFIEELYVHVPTSEERFEEMCLKWEALFKQGGIL